MNPAFTAVTRRWKSPVGFSPAHSLLKDKIVKNGSRSRWAKLLLLVACCCTALFGRTAWAQDKQEFDGQEGLLVTVAAPYTDIHTGPGRGYPVFHVAERHEQLLLLKRRTDWYKVTTRKGKTGWVRQRNLETALTADGTPLDFSVGGWEAYQEERWELGVLGGTFSGTRSLNVFLGYRTTENLSAELRYSQAFGEFSDSKLASINIVHRPFPDWRFSPFITLGAGAIKTSPNAALVETEDRQDNLLSAGAGAVYYLTQRFALRLEYNHHVTLTTRDDNQEVEEWKAGFSVSF